MAKPILLKIKPFDAKCDYEVSMSYSGNLPYSNKITIYNAESLSVVFTDTVSTHLLKHTIPANTLTNGTKYAIECQMFDSKGTASVLSDKVYFWCYETPTFEFEGLNNEDTIENSTISLTLKYWQSSYEKLYSFKFFLYDSYKAVLNQSDMSYDTSNLTYEFKGLGNRTVYYVRATGITNDGIELDTGFIQVFTDFANPNTYARIYTECDENGTIHGYTNITMIEPTAEPDDYEFDGGYINLQDNTLVYDQDFLVSGDFTISIRLKGLKSNVDILKASNSSTGFTLSNYRFDDGIRFKLVVPNILTDYILYSEPLVINSSDVICIHIRRINNIYSLKVFVEAIDSRVAMHFGMDLPTNVSNYDVWIDLDQDTVKVSKDDVVVYYQEEQPTDIKQYNVWIK